MEFRPIEPRANWRERAQELGYLSTIFDDPPYWVEALSEPFCAVFSAAEIDDTIGRATSELIQLALRAVDHVCTCSDSDRLLMELGIPVKFHDLVRNSWKRADPSLYGRFDFSYGNGSLKLLELNFDTAVSLYEAAVFQWIWLEEMRSQGRLPEEADQFNTIHEHLINAFKALNCGEQILHFASSHDAQEEEDTVRYLQSCAMLANVKTKFLYMRDLGYDVGKRLIDLENEPIRNLFKLYPWEYLFAEDEEVCKQVGFSILVPALQERQVRFFEPLWKCVLSSKAILPILWQMEPECPWLLEAALEGTEAGDRLSQRAHARKPIFGREGGSVSLVYPGAPERSFLNPGHFGEEGFVLQDLNPLPRYKDYHVLLGSWAVNGKPAGIGIRADLNPITTGTNCVFIPHYITFN